MTDDFPSIFTGALQINWSHALSSSSSLVPAEVEIWCWIYHFYVQICFLCTVIRLVI
uniref:Uncharacterized protein n=1 Tax=Nelumbo nucifera TaxID=4432 RepID=A0A822XLU9_NELNU|nr:TPA_asm: hypothetical protein HUJ06_021228 [Nelumbo nucifera]